jgi:murein DD-endopeptidase MepM/ murein hydrolase activator NlpD
MQLDFSGHDFHPVVHIPVKPVILDLTGTVDLSGQIDAIWSIGRYDEKRVGYDTELFSDGRCVHVGIDIGGPIGTEVMAFADGKIYASGYNPAAGDYGHVIVTEHQFNGRTIWALYGHLDSGSSENTRVGRSIIGGEVLGRFGDRSENGGWPPHLHFQLGIQQPVGHDMPGVVLEEERESSLLIYPDPRIVLGPLY